MEGERGWREEGGLKSQIENAGDERIRREGWRAEAGLKSEIVNEQDDGMV